MLLELPGVLEPIQAAEYATKLDQLPWQPGKATAGGQASRVKQNWQAQSQDSDVQIIAQEIRHILESSWLLQSAALPRHILLPMFNAYQEGGHYGNHVDAALLADSTTRQVYRSDLSLTLFLSPPDSYDGGELVIEDNYGEHLVKLDVGDAILYPSTSLHRVEPVTRGIRLAAVTWIESRVADDRYRRLLFELDIAIMGLRQQLNDNHTDVTRLTQIYHNLLRLNAS